MYTILSISQNYYLRGGSDRVYFETNRLLEVQGHRVIPFSAQDSKNETTSWENYFPRALNFEHPHSLDLAHYIYSFPAQRALKNLLRHEKPDLAHLHIYYGKLTSSILRPLKRAGIPIVQTLHEYKLVCPVYTLISNGRPCEACKGHHFYQALPRRCNRGTLTRTAVSVLESYVSYWCGAWSEIDHFIAVSDFQRNKIIQFGMPEDKISTIQNFVDASDIPPNQDPGAYLLYFGRIERVKGLFTLLEAIAPLTTIPLKIVGEGNAGVEVEDYVNDRNLKHVKIMGFQSGKQLHELIHNCMVVIVPSEWYETFGLTVLEAFAHGRPVIASTIGALPELVNDGEDGLLFPPGDVLALREKILWASKNSDLLVKMGQFGRKKVETLFTAERYYRELISIYRRILG